VIRTLKIVPAITDLARGGGKATYTVELPMEAVAGLAEGNLTWNMRPNGTLPAVVRQANSEAVAHHVSLRPADLQPELLSALNQLAVQTALATLVSRLEHLDEKVDQLLRESKSDRHGTARAGHRLYEQALEMTPGSERRMALVNAAQSLEEGRSTLLERIKAELTSLRPPSTVKAFWSGLWTGPTATEKLDEAYKQLCDDVAMALMATRWLALAYEELEQPGAALKAVEQAAAEVRTWMPLGREIARAVSYSDHLDPDAIWRLSEVSMLSVARRPYTNGATLAVQVKQGELTDD
jgi:hypothetical protein